MVQTGVRKCDLPAEWRWLGELPDYSLDALVSESSRSRVYAATRRSDAARVLLKSYVRDETGDGRSRTLRELATLERVAGHGVPRALGLVESPYGRALVLEHVRGVLLSSWRVDVQPDVRLCLRIGQELARALERVHRMHVIHGDIAPSNLLIDPETHAVCLIDFGVARSLGSAIHHREIHSAFSARPRDLQFIAPEQAGRMGRGVDARSDLYSLGATFYFLLTGAPLFDVQDPLALIHAHMAVEPVPPDAHRGDIPPLVSEVVSKLLRKEPEQRYASAELLLLDLAYCAEVIDSGTASADSVLPSALRALRPRVAARLCGRERDLELLERAFASSIREGLQWALVSGPSGMGKSALVSALGRRLGGSLGYLIAGKFDSYRAATPYAGFRSALESLAFQLLSEPDARLEQRGDALREALGPLAGVLVSFVSDFGSVLGAVPPVVPLGPRETRSRLALVIARTLATFACAERPLILFLDDVQWADAGSRFVLLDLLEQLGTARLLLVMTLRDGASSSERALAQVDDWIDACVRTRAPAARIELGALAPEAVAELLAQSLGSTPSSVDALATVVHRRTSGSPLLVKEFLDHLHAIGELHWSEGRWVWDVDRVATAAIPDGAVGLILAKLHSLEPATREILELASCIGDAFDSRLLAELAERPIEQLEPALERLTEIGVLVSAAAGLRFVHDRVREAARGLSTESARAELHQRLGILLLDRSSESDRAVRTLEIADHLRRGRGCLTAERRMDVLQAFVAAGGVALAAGAPHSALVYFEDAVGLVETSDWEREPERCYAVYAGAGEAAFQSEEYERAIAWLEVLEGRAWHPLRAAQVTGLRICAGWQRSPAAPEHLDAALLAFRRYGIRWPRSPSGWWLRWRVLQTDFALRGDLTDERFAPGRTQDLSWAAPLWMLALVAPVLLSRDLGLMLLATCDSLTLYLRHGTIHGPALALISYAAYRARVIGDLSQLERFASACSAWLQRVDHGRAALRAEVVLYGFVLAWIRPRRDVIGPLDTLTERFREVGDIDQVRVCGAQAVSLRIASGAPLAECIAQARLRSAPGFAEYCGIVADALDLLHEPRDPARIELEVEQLDARMQALLVGNRYWVPILHWLLVLSVLRRFRRAREIADRLAPLAGEHTVPGPYIADLVFMHAFVSAADVDTDRRARRSVRRVLRAALARLSSWSRFAPDVVSMVSLLEAEQARLRGRNARALARYTRAANEAGAGGHSHLAALAHERGYELLALLGDARAQQAREDAIARYFAWGAMGKRDALRREARS